MPEPLLYLDARTLTRRLHTRELSCVELMQACLDRIEHVDAQINAVPTLRPREALLAEAHTADRELARGDVAGPLHGLPFAVKDLTLTKGIRTTFGSRIYADFVPDTDEILVERVRGAGAIIIGKTNTPEFGAGSQTFNAVFGATRNPYDLTKTCGGSSGGAAAALASGIVPLADGSDLGGSLRNPASFCNVVGFRPSPGRVPKLAANAWSTLSVHGPMARSVADVAFLMSVIAGPDPRDPVALDAPGKDFGRSLERSFAGTRVAWSRNLGRYAVEPTVTDVCDAARHELEALGCTVDDGEPDFDGVDDIFQTLRAWSYAESYRNELARHRDLLKDTVIWNIEQGLGLSAHDIAAAEAARAALYRRVMRFMADYEFLVLPVSQVVPFAIEIEWIKEIDGTPMRTYIDWMATCYAITCTGLPAISVPCGFTDAGLPVGLQIVGRHHCDFAVLELAHAFEQATHHARRRPALG